MALNAVDLKLTDKEKREIINLVMDVLYDANLWGNGYNDPIRVRKLKKQIYSLTFINLSDIDNISYELCDILSEELLTESKEDSIMSFYQWLIDKNMMDN